MEPNIEDKTVFAQDVNQICDLYHSAQERHEQGEHLVSVDEKTGIQALEFKMYPMKLVSKEAQTSEIGSTDRLKEQESTLTTEGSGAAVVSSSRLAEKKSPKKRVYIERREFEYTRHGTQCLTANFEVATGRILSPTIEETRTEEDFVKHIQQTLALDPSGKWTFIADHLNTHLSESLVRLIAAECHLEDDLGVKSKLGILKSIESRCDFLQNPSHRIRFVYTPKHCSWLNQVEMWFGILVRRLLKRRSFVSKEDLKEGILNFIKYFNETMAKPFKWTYKGIALCI